MSQQGRFFLRLVSGPEITSTIVPSASSSTVLPVQGLRFVQFPLLPQRFALGWYVVAPAGQRRERFFCEENQKSVSEAALPADIQPRRLDATP